MQFSIIIPTYRRTKLLSYALKSVLVQNFSDYEVIIVNNDDNEIEVAPELLKSNVTIVNYNFKKGPAVARNFGCSLAKGEYVIFLDDDDVFKKGFLNYLSNIISRHLEPSFFWSDVEVYENENGKRKKINTIQFKERGFDECLSVTDALSIGTGYGLTCKLSTLKDIGYFDSSLNLVEDTDLIIKLLQYGVKPISLGRCYIEVNKHSSSQLTSTKYNSLRVKECNILLNKHKLFFDYNSFAKKQLEKHIEYLSEELVC